MDVPSKSTNPNAHGGESDKHNNYWHRWDRHKRYNSNTYRNYSK